MRTLTIVGGSILVVVLSGGTQAQTPPAQGTTPGTQTGNRGQATPRPPLLPTLTARPTPDRDGNFVIGPPYTSGCT